MKKKTSDMCLLRLTMLAISCISIVACGSPEPIEEKSFRENLVQSLKPLCEKDKACETALEEQSGPCMEKSGWSQFFNNNQDKDELIRFTRAFYGCIVDDNGKPFFGSSL